MSSPVDSTFSSSTDSRLSSSSFHVSGAAGTSTRNRLNASLGKRHFVLESLLNDPSSSSSISSSSKAFFDAVPRNAEFDSLKPILARLPVELDDQESLNDDEADVESLDYVLSKSGRVMYTRSRLPFLDQQSIDLWKALHHFQPLTADYASGYLDTAPPHPLLPTSDVSACPAFTSTSARALAQLRTSFNWSTLPIPSSPASTTRKWYGVLFLSVRKAGSESLSFYEADRLSHEEATRSGGLIMYWYGSPHPTTGANLATCIWASRTAAVAASKLPLHHKAARYAAPSYQRYDLVRYKVVKHANDARLRIEAWTSQDDREEQQDLQ
ncbi:hypothetical protein PHSY_000790 [Pseudozyma hubeiensis SY62]|uniref:Uncharacterized protein n=1 Tax=Pseudozyma hubeiensis (strain SY62) TaxID=1305764 RepID=R9NXE7_PSEHS|nr:hypothetical protein PHSY_000790 [Pseudozyma hubeiensis SY62]GAC93227.1 hypothetical protein PHSY_000790 [Pseudozyma hubeiensis SY62]